MKKTELARLLRDLDDPPPEEKGGEKKDRPDKKIKRLYERSRERQVRAITLEATLDLQRHSARILVLRELRGTFAAERAYAEKSRPQTRADCVDGPRPCPWVSCKFHLAVDVKAGTGSIKLNFPDENLRGDLPEIDFNKMRDTCALDVADRGGVTLEEVALDMNLTCERVRQVEVSACAKLHTTLEAAPSNGNGIDKNKKTG